MLKTHRGSCHCGAVRFEADLDLTQPTFRCNCTICRRTRFWAAVARPEGFRLLGGERAFGVGNETPIGKMYGVNLGCLDVSDEELAKLEITYVDGLQDRWDSPPAAVRHL